MHTNSADKRILIIGGTRFIGPKVLEVLQELHEVTIFHRGLSRCKSFPNTRVLIGDRSDEKSIEALEIFYDVVIDMCAYKPTDLIYTSSIKTNQYILISSVAIYSENIDFNSAENGKRIISKAEFKNKKALIEGQFFEKFGYGELKYLTELEAKKKIKDLLVVRPAIVLGPGDNSNRMDQVVQHSQKTVETFANPKMYFQYVDVRDIANFLAIAIKQKLLGEYNLTAAPVLWDDFFNRLTSLLKYKLEIKPRIESSLYPYYDPFGLPNIRTLSSQKAISEGWKPRDLEETLRAYLR
jgi:2'-hydroxyisoflavone reductase